MDTVGPAIFGNPDDRGDVKIRPNRFARLTDHVSFVGLEAVQGVAVFVGVNCHGSQAEFMGTAEDTNRNFTAVGNKQLGNGRHGGCQSAEVKSQSSTKSTVTTPYHTRTG